MMALSRTLLKQQIKIGEREKQSLVKIGVRGALSLTRSLSVKLLKAYQRGNDIGGIVESALLRFPDLLIDAMVAGHLIGRYWSTRVVSNHLVLKVKHFAGVYEESVRFMRERTNLDPEDIKVLRSNYRSTAINVAKSVSDHIENGLREAMTQVTAKGMHVKQGMAHLRQRMDALGVTPKGNHLLETLVRTQLNLAYNAGRWEANKDPIIQEILTGYEYFTVGDDRVRDTHAPLDGIKMPKDDPIWDRIWPPNGYNCRCTVVEIFEPFEEKPPPDTVEVEGRMVVPGPDEGFDFNVGKLFGDVVDANKAQVVEEATKLKKAMAKPPINRFTSQREWAESLNLEVTRAFEDFVGGQSPIMQEVQSDLANMTRKDVQLIAKTDEVYAETLRKIELIEEAIKTAPQVNEAIYRGMAFASKTDNSFVNLMKMMGKEGNEFSFKTLTSFSTNEKYAREVWGTGGNVSVRVRIKKGPRGAAKVDNFSLLEDLEENEVLVTRDNCFKVMKISKKTEKFIGADLEIIEIELEEITKKIKPMYKKPTAVTPPKHY